jgi:hypothetical protein
MQSVYLGITRTAERVSARPGLDKFWDAQALEITARTFLLAGMIAACAAVPAHAQDTMPDSQVEANVLKALAGAPDLAGQNITTNTVYGVVTLSGNVPDDAARTKAENLAANASGVKKVVDELQVGGAANAQNAGPGPGMVLQSDGTYAPAQQGNDASASLPPGSPAPGTAPATGAVMNDPDNDQAAYGQAANGQTANNQTPYGQPQNGQPQANPNGAPPAYPQNGYPQQQPNGYPAYPQQGNYPQQNGYAQNGYPQNNGAPYGGQVAGQQVIIPAGTMVRIRVNRLLASDRLKPGDHFDGVVANDVTAGGFVAIPRGASVQGVVVDSKSSGAISGRGELSLQLTSVSMGGKLYPIASDVWKRSGPDKTGQTVGSAAGLGIVGALIGGIAGRGAGAAIGAGVGAGAGVAASAASPKGQVVIPPEGMVTFNLAQPANVATVSEQEMQRLAYGVPSGQPPRQQLYGRPYPGYYPGYPPPPPQAYPPY